MNRTCDLRFRKPTLYPLSYEGNRTYRSVGGWVKFRRVRIVHAYIHMN